MRSNGSIIYFSTFELGAPNPAVNSGLLSSPNLWLGAWDLIKPIWVPFISTFTFSKTEKVPEAISISINFGTISGIPLSKKW